MAITALTQRATGNYWRVWIWGEKESPYLQHETIHLTAGRLEGLSSGWIHLGESAAQSPCPCISGEWVDDSLYAPDSLRCIWHLNPVQKPVHCLDIQPKKVSSQWAVAGICYALFWRGSKHSQHWKIDRVCSARHNTHEAWYLEGRESLCWDQTTQDVFISCLFSTKWLLYQNF